MTDRKQKALFIDRDGIINEDTGYPHKPEHIKFHAEIFDICRVAQQKGYLLIVITNQAGVAKGKFPEEDVRVLHAWMKDQFTARGVDIAAFYYCPHHKDGVVPEYAKSCNCRKPKPGMIEQAQRDFQIDIPGSLVIGDKASDRIEMPGLRSFIVKSIYTGDSFDIENSARIIEYI